jgi:Flp pilus assembly protein TadG
MIKKEQLLRETIDFFIRGDEGKKHMILRKSTKAQSFIEFALVIPILLLVLLGVVELTLFIGTYINLLDLTREAARYASSRDPFQDTMKGDFNCSTSSIRGNGTDNFFWDTACIFSQLEETPTNPKCTDAAFCNGFNSTVAIKSNEDDILISVFTETGQNQVVVDGITTPIDGTITANEFNNGTNSIPWVWSDHDTDTAHNANWRRNCNRLASPTAASPTFTNDVIKTYLQSNAMANKGFVVVEIVYCYHQVLNIPILSQFLPDPMQVHTYTIMPLPAAQPTRTPNVP